MSILDTIINLITTILGLIPFGIGDFLLGLLGSA